MPSGPGFNTTLCADINGFSLLAVVPCGVDYRNAKEELGVWIYPPFPH
jgi:hypothetical protein